jgi:hypothetical protein
MDTDNTLSNQKILKSTKLKTLFKASFSGLLMREEPIMGKNGNAACTFFPFYAN